MLWILFSFSKIRAIKWWQFQNHNWHRLDFGTGKWSYHRFLQIEAWNACRIFYSLGLMRPLQVSKKNFWDIFSKIRFHSFVGLDLENRLSTHNMVISFELKAKKSIWWKNQNSFFECPFEIIGFRCWLKILYTAWIWFTKCQKLI